MDLLQWSINFLIKNLLISGIKNEIISNKELAEELHKPIITKFKKRKVHSTFIDEDLADMQLISKFNKGFRFLLCVIGIHSEYAICMGYSFERKNKTLKLLKLLKSF